MEILKIKNTVLQAGRPKVAVPLMSQQPQEIIAECERAALLPCDLIEWRADSYLSGIADLEEVLQEKDFYLGMDDFMRMVGADVVFPMHFWGDFEVTDRFKVLECAKDYKDRIVKISTTGESFEI